MMAPVGARLRILPLPAPEGRARGPGKAGASALSQALRELSQARARDGVSHACHLASVRVTVGVFDQLPDVLESLCPVQG